MIRFGGPILSVSDEDPYDIVRACRENGYSATFAPNVRLNDTVRMRSIQEAFQKGGIIIGEVGFWGNLVDIEERVRKRNHADMVEALAIAEELGACCAVNTFGSYCHGSVNSKHSARNFSSEAFDEAVGLARHFIDEVRPKQSFFAYEVFPFNVIDSPEMIAKLIKAVDRKQFGVHLDLVNMINSPRLYWNNGLLIDQCIRFFGDRIVSSHAKDIRMKEPSVTVMFEEAIPGQGVFDFAAVIRQLHRLPRSIPYLMERLQTEQEYKDAAFHIRKIATSEGIRI